MSHNLEPYPSAHAIEAAIKAAAKRAAALDPSLDTAKRIQLEYFNRFLSRVFSGGENSSWVLKGGTSILARVASSRSTRDIDLYLEGFTLEEALEDLRRLAAQDLRDHFRFVYTGYEPSIANDAQPYTQGYRVSFAVFLGATRKGSLQIDLAVGAQMTEEAWTSFPSNALELPRLTSYPYRLYPVVDQIADKVCATMSVYDGRPSSREKDLVDLVVFARTQTINGDALSLAIETERRRRQLDPFTQFAVPATWGRGYINQSKSVPYCADYPSVRSAAELVSHLIDPVLTNQASGKTCSPRDTQWMSPV